MSKLMRVKQAADYLGVTPQTIRNWSNMGELKHSFSGANQRLYSIKDLDAYKNSRLGIEPKPEKAISLFYIRSSGSSDVSHDAQREKLVTSYGNPDKEFKDTSSGLNDNRKELTKMLEFVSENNKKKIIYVTNKDRLTRFGFNYLEMFVNKFNGEIVVLDSDETKEPHEILLQDFMSLLASFSGKFYRLRGWKQRKQFLGDVQHEVDKHVK